MSFDRHVARRVRVSHCVGMFVKSNVMSEVEDGKREMGSERRARPGDVDVKKLRIEVVKFAHDRLIAAFAMYH